MYQLSIPGQVFTTPTLSGVFALFANEAVQATETTLINLEGGAAAVRVTRYNGTLGIRRDGTVADIVAAMFDEIRSLWLSTYGPEPKPWQIRASHWELLFECKGLPRPEAAAEAAVRHQSAMMRSEPSSIPTGGEIHAHCY
ncbi:hypothetical protein ACLFKU_43220, partial [Paraburkholderia sp. EG304]